MIQGGHFFLILLLSILLYTTNQKIIHQQTTLQQQKLTYFSALQKQESDLKKSLGDLKKQIEFLHQNIKQVNNLPSMKIVALEEGLADQRDALYNIQQLQSIPFRLKPSKCSDLSKDEDSTITTGIKNIQDDLDSLKASLDKLENNKECSICKELKKQYDWNQAYLKQLQSTRSQKCPTPLPTKAQIDNLKDFTRISNLNAQNWVYGSSTQTQYYLQLFTQSTHKNINKCPLEKPFVLLNKNECQNCPSDTPYFDISTKKCIKCEDGNVLSAKEHKCVKPIKDTIIPSTTKCLFGKSYNFQKKQCQCPGSAPYFDGQICISCILPQYFNPETKKCDKCQQGKVYNAVESKCKQCPPEKPIISNNVCSKCQPDSYFDKEKKVCIPCPKSQKYDSQTSSCKCPSQIPYFDGSKCLNCQTPKFFSLKNKRCEQCKDNQVYNQKQNSCIDCPQNAPIADGLSCVACKENFTYIKKLKQCVFCPKGMIFDEKQSKCSCPINLPFYNGNACQECLLPKYWNKDSKKCEECPVGKFYNVIEEKCQGCSFNQILKEGVCTNCPQKTYPDNSTNTCKEGQDPKIPIKCYSNYQYNRKTKQCECPEYLFNNGKECIECYLPKYWNLTDKRCYSCPIGQTYIIAKKKCLACADDLPLTPVTKNYTCEACPDKMGYNKLSEKCEQCTNGKLYNSSTRKCEVCPPATPLSENGICKACPEDTQYKADKLSCVDIVHTCPQTFEYSKNQKKCVCPLKTPFNDTKKCVSCYLPKYWDYNAIACLSCPPLNVYDTKLKHCVKCPNDKPIASGRDCVSCPANKIFNKEKKDCEDITSKHLCDKPFIYNEDVKRCICPPETPFAIGQTCIACVSPKYWNLQKRVCQECPAKQTYNQTLKKCN